MNSYGYGKVIEQNHYQVGPDTWIYLFESECIKYVLIVTDYLGDYDFDVFPRLLKFNDGEFNKFEFVLQREVPIKDKSSQKIVANTILFEYTN